MAFDLYAIQKDIKTYLETTFPQYTFYRNTVPEDKQVPREGEEVNPFFVLQFGKLYRRPRGRSMKGPRNDQYFSWMQAIAIGSVDEDNEAALSLITDRLIGYKAPSGSSPLEPDGGDSDYGSRQYSVRPVLYYQTQRFEFNVNQQGINSYLTA